MAAVSQSRWFIVLLIGQRDQSSLAAFLEPVTLPADVDGGGVMQQPVEDGCCDDGIAEDRAVLRQNEIRRK